MARKLILDVPDELWEQFKSTVLKDKTLNDAIVELIQERVDTWEVERE